MELAIQQNKAYSTREILKGVMLMNMTIAESIFNLAKDLDMLDSQEFIDWQDKLNEISIRYK